MEKKVAGLERDSRIAPSQYLGESTIQLSSSSRVCEDIELISCIVKAQSWVECKYYTYILTSN